MKAWLLYALVLFSYLETAQCCSCTIESLQRPRNVAIRDDFSFSQMVYSARVVGATCNCVTAPLPEANVAIMRCVDYVTQESTRVSAEVVALGECDGDVTFGLDACANLNGVLSVDTNITMRMDLPTVNLTALAEFGRCPLVCPFNNRSSDIVLSYPCQYTVEVLEIYKAQDSFVCGTTRVEGPDVLTTCGNPTRRLHIGETYLVGVGGPCNPISEWSTLASYSDAEIGFLELLSDGSLVCGSGALGIVPSLVTLLLCTLLIVVMAI